MLCILTSQKYYESILFYRLIKHIRIFCRQRTVYTQYDSFPLSSFSSALIHLQFMHIKRACSTSNLMSQTLFRSLCVYSIFYLIIHVFFPQENYLPYLSLQINAEAIPFLQLKKDIHSLPCDQS